MRPFRIALVAGLTAMSVAIVIVLAHGPVSALGSNGVEVSAEAYTNGGIENCQGGGTLPRGTTAVRISLLANVGPSVSVKVISSSRVLTTGRRGSGWGTDASVTVPVEEVHETTPNTVACVSIERAAETIGLKGAEVARTGGKRELWLRLEYLHPGDRSWLSLASSIANEFDPARSPGGTTAALLAIALMLGAAAIATRVIVREIDRGGA